MYIKYFNYYWSTKSSHSRADLLPFFSSVLNESPLWYFWLWRISLFFWWGCPSFHFLIYNINSTSSPKIMYSNLFLFTTASFYFLIYNINVIFLLQLRILISSNSLLLTFTSSFIILAWKCILHLHIPIYSSSLMLASFHCGMLALHF